jgi:recombinational DNA repair protein RecT
MYKNIFKKTVLISAILFLASCDDDEPEIVNEEEEFSRVVITVTNESDQSSEQYTFEVEGHGHDGESESTEDPHEDHLKVELAPNSSYLSKFVFTMMKIRII